MDSLKRMNEALQSLGQVFARVSEQLQALRELNVLIRGKPIEYDVALAMYRHFHKRLPGSNRTARLRKKRTTVIMNWYRRYSK